LQQEVRKMEVIYDAALQEAALSLTNCLSWWYSYRSLELMAIMTVTFYVTLVQVQRRLLFVQYIIALMYGEKLSPSALNAWMMVSVSSSLPSKCEQQLLLQQQVCNRWCKHTTCIHFYS
jgi:hypothetical protein